MQALASEFTYDKILPVETGAQNFANAMIMKDQRTGQIERRIKIMTTGLRRDACAGMDPADLKIDSADPSLVMPITYPNGKTKFRINFSGLRYIEADSIEEIYQGGVKKVQRSRGFYADGTEMVGAYHNSSWPWDAVTYRNDEGEWIALGGVMQQPAPGTLPDVEKDNQTRSRWWGTVEHIETAPGVYEERIYWQAPIHPENRAGHDGWVWHGYGGTLLTAYNKFSHLHEPVRLPNGNYLLSYERVTEERELRSGVKVPWMTKMFVREMAPSLKTSVGPEILATDIISPITGAPYRATARGQNGDVEGYLAEGGNVFMWQETDQAIKSWSGNDYVGKYGIYLSYRQPGEGAVGRYQQVIDDKGELIDFADQLQLREILRGQWLGRPQISTAPDGKLWLAIHFVPNDSLPIHYPRTGWPSREQFPHYGRISALVPITMQIDEWNQPMIKLDIDPAFTQLYRKAGV